VDAPSSLDTGDGGALAILGHWRHLIVGYAHHVDRMASTAIATLDQILTWPD